MITGRKFPKSERLRNETLIAALFKLGKRYYYGEFTLIKLYYDYKFDEENSFNLNKKSFSDIQFFVSVRKKDFKNAVKRNKIKRLIKESYRNNKFLMENLEIPDKKILIIGVLYFGKEVPTYGICSETISSFIKNNIMNNITR